MLCRMVWNLVVSSNVRIHTLFRSPSHVWPFEYRMLRGGGKVKASLEAFEPDSVRQAI